MIETVLSCSKGQLHLAPVILLNLKQPDEPHFYIAKLLYMQVYTFFSSPEPLGSQGELIGWP